MGCLLPRNRSFRGRSDLHRGGFSHSNRRFVPTRKIKRPASSSRTILPIEIAARINDLVAGGVIALRVQRSRRALHRRRIQILATVGNC